MISFVLIFGGWVTPPALVWFDAACPVRWGRFQGCISPMDVQMKSTRPPLPGVKVAWQCVTPTAQWRLPVLP
ncbi:hypothetical protein B0T22DRAFT_123719 [Podospora appendiculata]|uniref:Secreted protein n=1 Tax=Podospora appendiculata TaxID=314037 RepID=A0AAE0X713_9PEZI|nr:hypothetical protein B0T22DRAFT_123719 [Podospora appendiculata]